MVSLVLSMGLGMLLGYLLKKYPMTFLSPLIQVIICLLLFSLGWELGADHALLRKIGPLGIMAVVITLCALLGSMLVAAGIYRLFFLPNRQSTEPTEQEKNKESGFLKSAVTTLAALSLGLIVGITGLSAPALVAEAVPGLLYLLLFTIGLSMGRDHTVFRSARAQGYRIFLLPAGTLVGTLAGAALAGWLLPQLRVWDTLSIGSGMGYYSLSSVLLGRSRGVEIGTIALISNILREFFTLFTAPLLVRIFGRLAPISAGGVTSMDITLPVIIRCSGKEYTALSVVHGAVLDPLVPVLVGLFGAM